MNKQSIKEILDSGNEQSSVQLEGWVRTKRDSKTFCFIEINDGSCIKNLQVIIDEAVSGYKDFIHDLTTGAGVLVKGDLKASPGEGQAVELHAKEVGIYGRADAKTYPLQKKRHSLEFLRELNHLRSRTNTIGAVMRIRHSLSIAIHQFFHEKGFYYIHTPIITGSDCEGAGQQFQVTTLPLDSVPMTNGQVDYGKDFFGRRATLTVSGQLEAETLALALGKVYTFGPTFRAEHSCTARHLAEFWMVEPEMAFCDINTDMDMAEEFLKYIFSYILKHCKADMDFFDQWVNKGIKHHLKEIVDQQFERITYTEAINILEKAGVTFDYEVHWGIDLQSEHEKYLTEVVYKKPVMVTGYPKEIKAFYMKMNEDGKTVRALDVLVPRLGEIIGGSEREDDYEKLKTRMAECGINPQEYAWYLDLRKYGSVPHAGFGLGFERVVQFVTGMQNIRDVIPFPRSYGNSPV